MSVNKVRVGTRFSGADWADQLRSISLVGCGGIGSWTALNLSRIGHRLTIWDGDHVDETNVRGGQLFRDQDINTLKVSAIRSIVRDMGSTAGMDLMDFMMDSMDYDTDPIVVTGLDNMKSRVICFENWLKNFRNSKEALFVDGRLLMENMEIFSIKGGDNKAIEAYKRDHFFDDSEVPELDCTTKQSTFCAMIISGLITATVCNFLTNIKLGINLREVPFHQKFYLPIFKQECLNIEEPRGNGESTPISVGEIIDIPEEEHVEA